MGKGFENNSYEIIDRLMKKICFYDVELKNHQID
jgi:hypothetical protein